MVLQDIYSPADLETVGSALSILKAYGHGASEGRWRERCLVLYPYVIELLLTFDVL